MDYLIHVAILAAIYSILVVSFNILLGYSGILALCHAVFYGVGAYSSALLMTHYGLGLFSSMGISVLFAAGISLFIAIPGLRVHWDYMIIFAFSFQMLFYNILLNWVPLTKGPSGIAGIPRPEAFGLDIAANWRFLIFAMCVAAAIIAVTKAIEISTFGLRLKGIRDDSLAVKSIGIDVTLHKVVAFAVSAGFASVAGTLIAIYISYISPDYFDLHMSVFILICLIFGGVGNINGAILGALVLTALPELLRFIPYLPSDMLGGVRELIYALILLFFILYRPNGIVVRRKRGKEVR